MKTKMNSTIRLMIISALSLSLSTLTACGGGGSSSDPAPVTTLPCSANPVLVQGTNTWQYSATDTRVCKPLTTANVNGACSSGQIKVRVPLNSNTHNTNTNFNQNTAGFNANANFNAQVCNYNQFGQWTCNQNQNQQFLPQHQNQNINNGYPNTSGSYREVCLNRNDTQSQGYIVNAGSYYYANYNQIQQQYQQYGQQYGQHYGQANYQLGPGETLLAIGAIGLILWGTGAF